tara:strand:+ start:281 stop:442 length:162 start_codon:yes stop_codon:yes gene_type:complete
MKKFSLIGKYPIISTVLIASIVFVVGPIMFALIIAGIIVLPMYLAVQILGDTE